MIRFRVRRARQQSFLPRLLRAWERRAPEVAELIRQAFWRGIPTRGVGGVVALVNLRERGLLGEPLQMIISDGGAGCRALHQRCGVHKMRNICEAVRRRHHDQVKREAQAIYQAPSLAQARRAFLRFKWNGQRFYPRLVKGLEKDLPERLNFYSFPRHLWRKLRTTNAMERCFVEVRRRTRPMVVFTNVACVDRILYAIFSRFNEDWKNRTLELFTQAA